MISLYILAGWFLFMGGRLIAHPYPNAQAATVGGFCGLLYAFIAAAKFPVEGLSLGDEEVLINGHPFVQAAASQKIKTSVALAMAANPQIRVMRIMDGSLLDSDAMKMIADMAEANNFQIWLESVSEGNGAGVIIEDGHVKE